MTTTELKIQTVTGLIKRSPVTHKSHLYKTKSRMAGRNSRTVGIYAEKNWSGNIVVSFDTHGYNHYQEKADDDIKVFALFAKAEGYKVEMIGRWSLLISKVAA